jgi:hypothetical protein
MAEHDEHKTDPSGLEPPKAPDPNALPLIGDTILGTILDEIRGIRADLSALGDMRTLVAKVLEGQVQIITALSHQSLRILRLERRFLALTCVTNGQADCGIDDELEDALPMGVEDEKLV